jgi:hypothetical protein
MNSPHRHERNRQAEKHGQATLSEFYDRQGGIIETTPSVSMPASRSMNTSVQVSLTAPKKSVRLMSVHKLPYIYRYTGTQPFRNAYSVAAFDRYGKTRQSVYRWNEDMAVIVALPHTLKIWIKRPKGVKLDEQIGEARERADAVARKFGMKFGLADITLTREPPNENCPDVIVEDKSVAKVLKPIVKDGSVPGIGINQTSHKGKVETDWNKGKELEYLLTGGIEARFDKLEARFDAVEHILERIAGIMEKMLPDEPKAPSKPYDDDMYR